MSDDFPLAAYLDRMGYDGPRDPSLEVLGELHRAHVAAFPFENLDILLGRSIDLDLSALVAKMITAGRGGYCFEQNTLFRAALEALGFEVTAFAARVRVGGGGGVRPRTHMLLRVEVPEAGSYLADVGFGGEGPIVPLPLAVGEETRSGVIGHRLRREQEQWVLEGCIDEEWSDLYAFTTEPQLPVDFVVASHFTSTFPRSPFVQNLTVQRSWPERRVKLFNRELAVRESGGVAVETIRDADHLLEVLESTFGLVFPRGTRFARPEF